MTKEEFIDKAIMSLEQELNNVYTVIDVGEPEEIYLDYIKTLKKQIQDLKHELIEHILLVDQIREAEGGLDE